MDQPFFALLGTTITIIGTLGGFMFWIFNKLDTDIKSVDSKLDSWIRHSSAMNAEQAKRTDRLYQMFVDLLKEGKK